MRFIETIELTDTNPKGYIGPPKVNKKTGKPLCKNGQEPDEEGNCFDDNDMHKTAAEIPDTEIANKHEEVLSMKNTTNPILRQELMNLGILLPKDKPETGITEESPVRKALNIMKNSPNTINENKTSREIDTKLGEAYKHLTRPIDREKAKAEGNEASKRAKETIETQKKKNPIVW